MEQKGYRIKDLESFTKGGTRVFAGVFEPGQHAPANGKYMLIIELFDSAGAQIKPNGATGPGTGKAFQFRRWSSDSTTENVPFSDCAHVFWIDNLAVVGDIVDLRKDGTPNPAECQFTSGVANSQFSIGYRAYHVNGVSNSDSFMQGDLRRNREALTSGRCLDRT